MTSVLNSPLEVGMRVLHVLAEVSPEGLDVNRLVLLDHCLIHSSDLGGPASLHPPLPIRSGELGVRRETIQGGLRALMNSGLVSMRTSTEGIEFSATDEASGFLTILASEYAIALRERAVWVAAEFGDLNEDRLRQQMNAVAGQWADEFYDVEHPAG